VTRRHAIARDLALPPLRLAIALCLAALPLLGCQIPRGGAGAEPLTLSRVVTEGDPARRASMRLVMGGLQSDEAGRGAEASSRYQRALQVDPNNPYAWLALARQEVFEGDPQRGLAHLDKAQALLGADERATAHLVGLRGAALVEVGQPGLGRPFLQEARELAPDVWSDGKLDAAELR
jgi:tetratricopeptide (TPR) repeat protein